MKIKIIDEKAGQRLDVFLTMEKSEWSRSQWQKKIKTGEVMVNGKEIAAHYKLREGDTIEITNDKFQISKKIQNPKSKIRPELFAKNNKAGKIKIIFENKDYAVVNKPAGIVVERDEKVGNEALVDYLIKKYPEIKKISDNYNGRKKLKYGIVHRLDKEASGLLVVARTQTMYNCLKEQFLARKINKEYLALVHKEMKQSEGEIKSVIARSRETGKFKARSDESAAGREAITKYEVVKKYRNFTLLRINILTGRTHQIRVHLSSIGYPLAGDKLYETHDIRVKKRGVALGRIWLAAVKLGFFDLKGAWREFKIETPDELAEFLGGLKEIK